MASQLLYAGTFAAALFASVDARHLGMGQGHKGHGSWPGATTLASSATLVTPTTLTTPTTLATVSTSAAERVVTSPEASSKAASTTPAATVATAATSTSVAAASGSLWQPAVGATWQIDLSNTLKIDASSPSVTPDVDIYDIDLFLHQDTNVISGLHQLGKKVICYFSAGSYEPDRPDSDQFTAADKGSELDGWPGEYWLDLNSANVRSIMSARVALAAQSGCDAIDPDNVDGYQNSNGLNLSQQDSINFMDFLAQEALNNSLSIGLKNAGDIISALLPVVQFSVNEQCAEYSECSLFAAFVQAGKPVFHIEYPDSTTVSSSEVTKYCSATGTTSFSTVLKDMNLDGWVEYCTGAVAQTAVEN